MPSVVKQGPTTKVTYTYLADGTKVQVSDASGNGFAYLGSLIYTKSGSSYTLESSSFGGGRIVNSSGTLTPYYYTTDHLGSVRLITNTGGAVAEQNDYFPFGGKHTSGQSYSTLAANRYKFNGKEEQTVGGLSYLDYGARMYDNVLGRWITQDPLGEKYYGISSYSYCNNNPVALINPDGRDWYQSVGGEIMWRKSISDQYVDDYSQIWKNIGETYTHLREDGSSTFFYQKTNDAGELSLASHAFSANEMAGFGLFHSDNAREAGMLHHVNPSWKSFFTMVTKEMAAQWTDPYLLTAGATLLMRPIAVREQGLPDFSKTAATHMEDASRYVPVQLLDKVIKSTKSIPDPKGSRARIHTIELWRNDKNYMLEILHDKKTNSIWHFKYNNK